MDRNRQRFIVVVVVVVVVVLVVVFLKAQSPLRTFSQMTTEIMTSDLFIRNDL